MVDWEGRSSSFFCAFVSDVANGFADAFDAPDVALAFLLPPLLEAECFFLADRVFFPMMNIIKRVGARICKHPTTLARPTATTSCWSPTILVGDVVVCRLPIPVSRDWAHPEIIAYMCVGSTRNVRLK